jgi:hypothetical protein
VRRAVFLTGFALGVGLAFAAREATDSESFLLLAASLSYSLYVLSSASIAISVNHSPSRTWALSYLVSMLPVVVLTSWLPITTAPYQTMLPSGIPWTVNAVASFVTGAALCYGTAWILVWLYNLLAARPLVMRVAVIGASIFVPISLWAAEALLAFYASGLA